jgi:thiol-disulfide isomerase/thioredoxin
MALLFLAWCLTCLVAAGDKPVTVYLFWTIGCPHCMHEREFLAALGGYDLKDCGKILWEQ